MYKGTPYENDPSCWPAYVQSQSQAGHLALTSTPIRWQSCVDTLDRGAFRRTPMTVSLFLNPAGLQDLQEPKPFPPNPPVQRATSESNVFAASYLGFHCKEHQKLPGASAPGNLVGLCLVPRLQFPADPLLRNPTMSGVCSFYAFVGHLGAPACEGPKPLAHTCCHAVWASSPRRESLRGELTRHATSNKVWEIPSGLNSHPYLVGTIRAAACRLNPALPPYCSTEHAYRKLCSFPR